jgi:hypothetical protein
MKGGNVTPKRRFPMVVLPIAAAFAGMALLWSGLAVPQLVKYPTDLDVTPRYQGKFTLLVDPTTAAPLATPVQVPLDIERHIRSLGDESGSSRVVVEETITQRAGDLVNTTQTNVYVMDRRTMQNVADDRAYAFDPSNLVDRAGSYRLNLPFDTSSTSTYPIYKNEIGTTYTMRADTTRPTTDAADLHLRNFTGSGTEVPLDQAYLADLNKVVSLPGSMTLEQLKPQLKAAGLDVDAVLAAVAPVISPDDLAVLGEVATKAIPLQYFLTFDGSAAVEPTTGAEVVVGATESVGAKPVLADVDALQAAIAHYPDVPEAVAAGEALAALSSAPATKLFEYRYQQTPASVADIADHVKSMRNQIRLVEMYVPAGLLGAGGVSLAVGAFVFWRRGRGPTIELPRAPRVIKQEPEREPVTSGSPR